MVSSSAIGAFITWLHLRFYYTYQRTTRVLHSYADRHVTVSPAKSRRFGLRVHTRIPGAARSVDLIQQASEVALQKPGRRDPQINATPKPYKPVTP